MSGDYQAYKYLNTSIEAFPYGDDFCALLTDAGFKQVKHHPVTFGIATVYEQHKVSTITFPPCTSIVAALQQVEVAAAELSAEYHFVVVPIHDPIVLSILDHDHWLFPSKMVLVSSKQHRSNVRFWCSQAIEQH